MKKRLKRFYIKNIINVKNYKLDNAIVIFSEKRGGSTWLMELLHQVPKTTINWEPLNGIGVVPKSLKFGEYPYIKMEDKNLDYSKFFKRVIQFKLYNNYTISYCKAKTILKSKYVITKFVSANSLIGWFTVNFNSKHKPIYLIRNPLDCCSSQLKTFEKYIVNRDRSKLPNSLNDERFQKHREFILGLKSDLEHLIAIWCINNVENLNNKKITEKCYILYYEHLLLNPKTEFAKLLEVLKLEDVCNIERINYRKASASNFKNNFIADKTSQLEKNKSKLSKDQLKRIQEIYDYFNFKLYKVTSNLPQLDVD